MTALVLLAILGVAVLGCVCVVWAARGGPRWVRGVASATLTAGEVVRRAQRGDRRTGPGPQDNL
ncbi:hypothetical protein ACIBI4_21790 [Streptomyces sp. NPDC050418]|uniref:hypothetical protein n=1 Tax=Streptomyces sp. NPDC050418 TaxID=3365612 RepID=UPI0037AB457B